jgi:NCAIR mutase (PurE)-related protein
MAKPRAASSHEIQNARRHVSLVRRRSIAFGFILAPLWDDGQVYASWSRCYDPLCLRQAGRRWSIDNARLRELLTALQTGTLSIDETLERLRRFPYEDLGFAEVDHHRALRKGFPEVILGQGKTDEQVVAIGERLLSQSDRLLVTRVDASSYAALKERIPDAVYHSAARAISVNRRREPLLTGVAVVCAGTSDLAVAEEAAVTAELVGSRAERIYDVGVAGLHRLLDHLAVLQESKVVVAVAGMEGALPSVVAGLVAAPVIAVPTSMGYGASFQGLTPLLAMLNSCVPGVAVVNIDNGFGAGYLAAMINRLAWQERRD